MKTSHLRLMADHLFGPALARTYLAELVLPELGGRTALAALDDGLAPRTVWTALCDELEVPEERRWEVEPGRSVRGGR